MKNNKTSVYDELIDLKKLLDTGVITQEDFEAKKDQILNCSNSAVKICECAEIKNTGSFFNKHKKLLKIIIPIIIVITVIATVIIVVASNSALSTSRRLAEADRNTYNRTSEEVDALQQQVNELEEFYNKYY